METGKLTHLDASGNASMVDVGAKSDTERIAIARGEIVMKTDTLALIRDGAIKKETCLPLQKSLVYWLQKKHLI
jgi:cyclic pyranopterin phosphate synthase